MVGNSAFHDLFFVSGACAIGCNVTNNASTTGDLTIGDTGVNGITIASKLLTIGGNFSNSTGEVFNTTGSTVYFSSDSSQTISG